MSTKEVEKQTGTELALVDKTIVLGPALTTENLEQIRDILTGQAEYEVPEADASAISVDILNKLLFAKDEEELLGEIPTWSSKESVGMEFRILPAGRLWPSSFINKDTGRKGAFLSMQAVNTETGEMGVFNTSSPRIVGKFAWYAKQDMLPASFRVVQISESSNGYPILDVEKTS